MSELQECLDKLQRESQTTQLKSKDHGREARRELQDDLEHTVEDQNDKFKSILKDSDLVNTPNKSDVFYKPGHNERIDKDEFYKKESNVTSEHPVSTGK